MTTTMVIAVRRRLLLRASASVIPRPQCGPTTIMSQQLGTRMHAGPRSRSTNRRRSPPARRRREAARSPFLQSVENDDRTHKIRTCKHMETVETGLGQGVQRHPSRLDKERPRVDKERPRVGFNVFVEPLPKPFSISLFLSLPLCPLPASLCPSLSLDLSRVSQSLSVPLSLYLNLYLSVPAFRCCLCPFQPLPPSRLISS